MFPKSPQKFPITQCFQLLNRQKMPFMLYFEYKLGDIFTLKWKIDFLEITLSNYVANDISVKAN